MRFLLTRELGRLAKWLRILGFDAEYFEGDKKASLIIKALQDERVILTRNLLLSRDYRITTLYIRSDIVYEQIKQVLFDLGIRPNQDLMFSRCTLCNQSLISVEKGQVKNQVPEYVFKTTEDFFSCPNCRKIYWQGSHWGNAARVINEMLAKN